MNLRRVLIHSNNSTSIHTRECKPYHMCSHKICFGYACIYDIPLWFLVELNFCSQSCKTVCLCHNVVVATFVCDKNKLVTFLPCIIMGGVVGEEKNDLINSFIKNNELY